MTEQNAAPCRASRLDELSRFAFDLNRLPACASAFCCGREEQIRAEFAESIAAGRLFEVRRGGKLTGVGSVFPDEEKSNADCYLLIPPEEDYAAAASPLLAALRAALPAGMHLTFFFPKENERCAAFLLGRGARPQVNEYCLLLHRGQAKRLAPSDGIAALQPSDAAEFAALHDAVFPDVYVSGAELLADNGRGRELYLLREDGRITAYGVLCPKRGVRMTAEIVGVREGFRHAGRGRRILSFLIGRAFGCGAESLDLIVDADNADALKLYLDLGFCVETENRCFLLPAEA